MKEFSLTFSAIVIWFVSVFGHAQDNSPTLAEEKAAFKKADSELNTAYQNVKASIPEWQFELLKTEQKEWLEFRDRAALSSAVYDDGPEFEGKETTSTAYWTTLAALTGTRAKMVAGWGVKTPDGEVSWAGYWTDGYGGWMRIAVADKVAGAASPATASMSFHIECVRGPTYHMGDITGKAKVNSKMAFFTDSGKGDAQFQKPQGSQETWLVFEKLPNSPQVKISGVNTSDYHGMRAYFDGTYTRIGDLPEDERKTMLDGKFDFGQER